MPKHPTLWRSLDEYWKDLQESPLADKSIVDYYYFAECFVRWLDGDFKPGAKVTEQDNNVGSPI